MKNYFLFLIIISVFFGSMFGSIIFFSNTAYAQDVSSEELPPAPDDISVTALGPEPPEITAASAIVMDASTGQIIYEKNAHVKQYPASITKIMTAYLALERCNPADTIVMSDDAVWGIPRDSSHIALDVDERITVEDAIYGMLLVSANEAALALAEKAGGSISAFVDLMNQTATELGCENTHFVNPNGLHDDNHYTSAYDMALITKQALTNDSFRQITATVHHEIPPTNKNDESRILWQNNKLLIEESDFYYPAAEGGKTGFTDEAQNTLVTWAKEGDIELICVLLKNTSGAANYEDSIALYNYVFENFTYQNLSADYEFDGEEITKASNYLCKIYDCENAGYMHLSVATDSDALMSNEIDKTMLEYNFDLQDDRIDEGIIGSLLVTFQGMTIKKLPVYYSGFVRTDKQEEMLQAEEEGKINPAYNAKPKKSILPTIFFILFLLLITAVTLQYIYVRRKRYLFLEKRRKQFERARKSGNRK